MKSFYTKRFVDRTTLLNETNDIIVKRNQTITRTLFWGLLVFTEETIVNQDLANNNNAKVGFNNKK